MVRVECYAGYKADERPVRLSWRGAEYTVSAVLERWSGPGVDGFRVRTAAGVFDLRHDLMADTWTAEECPRRS